MIANQLLNKVMPYDINCKIHSCPELHGLVFVGNQRVAFEYLDSYVDFLGQGNDPLNLIW